MKLPSVEAGKDTYPVERRPLSTGGFQEKHKVYNGHGDQGLLEDFDTFVPGGPSPFQRRTPSICLFKMELPFRI